MGAKKQKKVKPIVVIIRASSWWRGTKRNPDGANGLTDGHHRDCCLGRDGIACGISRSQMADFDFPRELSYRLRGEEDDKRTRQAIEWGGQWPYELENNASVVNDDPETTDEQKIKLLRPIFAKMDPPRVIDWRPNE